jgi:hypothetical protein
VTVAAEKTLTGITIELLPPASDASIAPTHEAPVDQDRSFFDSPKQLDDYLGADTRPRIPINPNTGLAYPIILSHAKLTDKPTRHHHNFPDSYLMGHALRHVYIQKVYARLHNDGSKAVHKQYSIPEELPEDPHSLLGTITMGLARHLPRQGLDLSHGEPTVRTMTPTEESRLMTPGMWGLTNMQRDFSKIPDIHMRWRSGANRRLPSEGEINPVHEYAGNMIMSMIGFIDGFHRRSRIFEQTSHPEVGFDMLRDAARVLVENTYFRGEMLSDKYKRARQDGRLREDSPAECGDLLIGVLGTRGGLGAVFQDLKLVTSETRAAMHHGRVVA